MTPTPPLRWRSSCGVYNVEIARRCFRAMQRMRASTCRTRSEPRWSAPIPKTVGKQPSPASRHWRRIRELRATSFQRGIDGLAQFFKNLFTRYRGRRHYVGEWHSHPYAAPDASRTDDVNQSAIAHDQRVDCAETILVIVGGDMAQHVSLQAYVYSRSRGKVVLGPV